MGGYVRSQQLVIRMLGSQEQATAAALCVKAMLDNPLHLRVFGPKLITRQRRLKRFFPGLLAYVGCKGQLYGAFVNHQLVGVLGVLAPAQCRPSLRDLFRLLPHLLRSNSLLGQLRLVAWLGTWAKIDLKQPHWHLGPLAVDPAWQRHGIGTRLLEHFFCNDSDFPYYLETDKQENVQFYKKFGFTALACPKILNTQSWVMLKSK